MRYATLLGGAALIALALGTGIPSQTMAQTLAQAVAPEKPDMSKTRTGKFRGGGGARRGGGGMGRAAVGRGGGGVQRAAVRPGGGAMRPTSARRSTTTARRTTTTTTRRGTVARPGAGGAGTRVVVRPVRPLVHRPYYGRVVAGVALGTVIAATAIGVAPAAPGPNMCWFWTDSSQTQGYWDYCTPPPQ